MKWFFILLGLVIILFACLPSKSRLFEMLENQHLPTPIFANWFQLFYIWWVYGK